VNAIQLLEIIKNGNKLGKKEYQQLLKLNDLFPYFQIPKVLLAKYEFENSGGSEQEMLQWAAITSPKRSWLKQLVETAHPYVQLKKNINIPSTSSESTVPLIDDLEGKIHEPILIQSEGIDREEALRILESKLKESKSDSNDEELELRKARKAARRAGSDDLIESIRRKDKKEILDEKKKAQIDIIKAFSKKEIKLATIKELENLQKQNDLSEKSTQLNPNFVTESYARMLTNQGKKQKAKEIYQKLMVKFPDKSTYFANLIKSLEE
jgi:hypothetical protein